MPGGLKRAYIVRTLTFSDVTAAEMIMDAVTLRGSVT